MTHEDAVLLLPDLVGLRAADGDDGGLRAHVERCPRCRARLQRLRDIDAGLRATESGPAPSADLERRVLDIPAGGAATRRPTGRRRRLAGAACAIVLAGALAGAFALRTGGPAGGPADRVVALAAPAGDVRARIEMGAPSGGRMELRVVAAGLAHGEGMVYGLWLTGPEGSVSGGAFMPDGNGRCAVMLQVPVDAWTAVDITTGDRPPSTRTTVAHAAL